MASLRPTSNGDIRSGWIAETSDNRIAIRFEETQQFKSGESFILEMFGRNSTAAVALSFSRSSSSDFYALNQSGALTSESALDLDFIDVVHHFDVISEFRYRRSTTPFRIAVWDVTAKLEFIGSEFELSVLNIGEEFMGCYCPFELDLHSKHVLKIATAIGELKVDGAVLECRAIGAGSTQFRALFKVEPCGRVDLGRWRRFVEQQSMAA